MEKYVRNLMNVFEESFINLIKKLFPNYVIVPKEGEING